jgi:hypothetical protein
MNTHLGGLDRSCTDVITLTALATDPFCVTVPGLSQIWGLVVSPCGTADDPFEIVSPAVIPTLVSGAIDNDAADNTKSRVLVGIGGVAEHEAEIYEGPLRRDLVTNRIYTLTHEIPLGDPLTYNFLRLFQRNYLQFRFWYIDLANLLYGTVLASTVTTSYGGIIPTAVNVQFPKDSARDARNVATLSITFEADVEPPRYDSPLTPAAVCVPA